MLEGHQIVELATTLMMSAAVVLLAYSPFPRALGQALAQRLLHGKAPRPVEPTDPRVDDLSGEMAALREQLEVMQERLDFTERLLAQAREKGQLGAGDER